MNGGLERILTTLHRSHEGEETYWALAIDITQSNPLLEIFLQPTAELQCLSSSCLLGSQRRVGDWTRKQAVVETKIALGRLGLACGPADFSRIGCLVPVPLPKEADLLALSWVRELLVDCPRAVLVP